MKGFNILRAGQDYVPDSGKTALKLLCQHNGVEVMIHTIKAGEFIMLTAGQDNDLYEFFYILNGKLTLELPEGVVTLGQNDSFGYSGIDKDVIMSCSEPLTLLYITSKPTFHHVKVLGTNLDEMINKINDKDHYTKLHCQHVMDYSIAISKKMKHNSPAGLELLAISALFHDVGKCCIPDDILNKPGMLTAEERKFIYKHPIESEVLVKENFGEEVAKIVLCHHERQDGSGYPQGLSGNDIPIEARIIAVADSFDAMTTQRPYNQPKTFKEAADELVSMIGIYDRDVVYALKELVEEEGFIPNDKTLF